MIKIGMVSATFRNKPAEDILRLCRDAELEAVEWSEHAHVEPDDVEGAAALYELTKSAGIEVAAYGSYFRLGQQENPETAIRASLISAAALQAPVIRIWAGIKPSETVSTYERTELAAEAALICRIAEEYQIKVALEWHKNTLTDTNDSAMRFLLETGHKNLYCLWQPTVALSMEERIDGLERLGDRLLNLHMYYWREGVRRPLSEGGEEWGHYLAHVDPHADRYGLLEFVMGDTEEQFLEDAKMLRKLIGR